MPTKTMPPPAVSPSVVNEILRLTALAPSSHNTQPWRIRVEGSRLTLRPDYQRRLPVVDPDDHALYISLGCALENLVLGARGLGLAAEVDPFPHGDDRIDITLVHAGRPTSPGLDRWIELRQVSRSRYDGRPIPADLLERLTDAAQQPGARMHVLCGEDAIRPLARLAGEGTRLQFSDPAFVAELLRWVRFTRWEARLSGDGITLRSLGLPSVPRAIGMPLLRLGARPAREALRVERQVRSSSAILVFTADRMDRDRWVSLGRCFQRITLAATAAGLQHAHANMPCEVPALRERLRRSLGEGAGHPLLMIRLGWGRRRPRSSRRSVAHIISSGTSPGWTRASGN